MVSLYKEMTVNSKVIFRNAIRNILLFAIAMILVLGFYYHSMFYSVSLEMGLVVGSIIVFGLMKLSAWINSHRLFQVYDGVLLFEPDEVEQVKNGYIKAILRKTRPLSRLKKGNIIRAKLSLQDKAYFAELLIIDEQLKRKDEITNEDAYLCGFRSKKELLEDWQSKNKRSGGNKRLRLIKFKVL